MITKESIAILAGSIVTVVLIILWLTGVIKKKERYLEMERKQERNESNERYEIIPESLYQDQNASSPYPPEPVIPFQIYDPQDINVDIIEITCDDDSTQPQATMMPTQQPATMMPTQQPTTMMPSKQRMKKSKENFQAFEVDVIGITEQKLEKPSTFCTCGGLIHQDCDSTFKRVDSYNKGNTEFSKFPDKGWNDVMPYDQWTEQPNYYNQNTNWFDVMPYDIYQSR